MENDDSMGEIIVKREGITIKFRTGSNSVQKVSEKHKCENVPGTIFPSVQNVPGTDISQKSEKNPQIQTGKKLIDCIECGKPFTEVNLVKHMRVHFIDRKYKCEHCDMAYMYQSTLEQHMKIEHSGAVKFKCNLCSLIFPNNSSLKKHLCMQDARAAVNEFYMKMGETSVNHNANIVSTKTEGKINEVQKIDASIKPHQCNVCGNSFKRKSDLNVHLKIHTEVKPYNCDQCNKSFVQNCNFRRHLKTHVADSSRYCAVCDLYFKQKNQLLVHMRIHDNPDSKRYKCDQCDKSFATNKYLKKHLVVHTGIKAYKCEICNNTFTQGSGLNLHIKQVHNKERNYHCTICGKTFASNTRLTRHMLIHTGERPYQCIICEKGFREQHHLKNHMQIHLKKNTISGVNY